MSTIESPRSSFRSAQGDLHDPVGVPGLRSLGVLAGRDAEEDDRGHAERRQPAGLLAQRIPGVLHDAGQGDDGLRLVDALPHEEGGDQVVGRQAGLGDHPPQHRACAAAGASGAQGKASGGTSVAVTTIIAGLGR